MRTIFWKILASVVVCCGSVSSFGQQPGDEVFVIVPKVEMKVGSTVVETVIRGNRMTVREVNGPWLWVAWGSTCAWVQRSDVVGEQAAFDEFTRAIQRNGRDYNALCARAIIWTTRGELTNAISDLTDAIRFEPTNEWGFHVRGFVWNAKHEYANAIADLNEAIVLDPKNAGAYSTRGGVLRELKQYDKAIGDYTEAIRLDPKNAGSYSNRGNVLRDLKQYDKAIADYTDAIRLDPKDTWAYTSRGNAFDDLKQYHKAIADFTEAMRLKPKDGLAYNQLAWLLATCPDAAVRDGERAAELAKKAYKLATADHRRAYWLDTLAAAYAEMGQYDKAVRVQEKALELCANKDKAELEAHLALFREGKPFRDLPPTESVVAAK